MWRSRAGGRRSSWDWAMPSEFARLRRVRRTRIAPRVAACMVVASLFAIADVRSAGPRFYPDDPLWVDNDRVIDVTGAHEVELDNHDDFLDRSPGVPKEEARHEREHR